MQLNNGMEINEKGHLTISGCDTVTLKNQYGTPLIVKCPFSLISIPLLRRIAYFSFYYAMIPHFVCLVNEMLSPI